MLNLGGRALHRTLWRDSCWNRRVQYKRDNGVMSDKSSARRSTRHMHQSINSTTISPLLESGTIFLSPFFKFTRSNVGLLVAASLWLLLACMTLSLGSVVASGFGKSKVEGFCLRGIVAEVNVAIEAYKTEHRLILCSKDDWFRYTLT